MLGLRLAIVALNRIFYWTCWDWGERLLPSIWCFSGHAGTQVSDCCPQSDLYWTCWDWGERLLPSIWSLTGHAGTEVSDCCPQSDVFLDMLRLRWALLTSIWSFSGHAGTEVSDCCPQSDLYWTCSEVRDCCPQSDLLLDMLGLRWTIVALNLILSWTYWDWDEWLLPSVWSFSGHAATQVSIAALNLMFFWTCWDSCERLLPSIRSLLDMLGLRSEIICPQSELFLDMLGLRWVTVGLNLIFFWTCWDWGEGLLPSIWFFSGHAGTEVSDCCPQSDLFLDMLALRLATALNYLFLDMLGLGRVIVAHNLSFSGHAGTQESNCCPLRWLIYQFTWLMSKLCEPMPLIVYVWFQLKQSIFLSILRIRHLLDKMSNQYTVIQTDYFFIQFYCK